MSKRSPETKPTPTKPAETRYQVNGMSYEDHYLAALRIRRRLGTALLLGLGLTVGAYWLVDQVLSSAENTAPPSHTELLFDLSPDHQLLFDAIYQAAESWLAANDCAQPAITIRSAAPILEGINEQHINNETIIAQSDAGFINFNNQFDFANQTQAWRVTTHEMLHACKSSEPTYLPTPLAYADGEIYAFHGFAILAQGFQGQEYRFYLLEEVAAEYIASQQEGYEVDNSRYQRMQNLGQAAFQDQDIMEYYRANNVPAVAALILNYMEGTEYFTEHNLTNLDLDRAMGYVQKTSDGEYAPPASD